MTSKGQTTRRNPSLICALADHCLIGRAASLELDRTLVAAFVPRASGKDVSRPLSNQKDLHA